MPAGFTKDLVIIFGAIVAAWVIMAFLEDVIARAVAKGIRQAQEASEKVKASPAP
jgi:hypothetical protein